MSDVFIFWWTEKQQSELKNIEVNRQTAKKLLEKWRIGIALRGKQKQKMILHTMTRQKMYSVGWKSHAENEKDI